MNATLRNIAILAVIALGVVVLNQETALATASTLVRFAFFIAMAVVGYFFWRDVGRREIETWPSRASQVFYAACALLVLDIGWYAVAGLGGRDAILAFVVGAICAYIGWRTWKDQKTYV